MLCPACKTVELAMTERQGIEIDYCPSCRGVWLDRGELDKIIERTLLSERAPTAPLPSQSKPHESAWGHHSDHHDEHGRKENERHENRRSSFWRDLFD